MTTYEEEGGKLVRIVDRTGCVWANLSWAGDRLAALRVPGLVVDGTVIDDPLLGRAHRVGDTTMSALDWLRPTEIPAIAAPAKIRSGAALMNVIAVLARRAGVPALRYAGPYPTRALWRTLLRSFRTTATEDAFTAGALDRMLRVARDPIAVDFVPAPHERLEIAGGHAEVRDGPAGCRVERVVLDGVAYEPSGSPARLVDARAELWFGDVRYAHVATLAADGAIVDGPHAIPACTSDVLGKPFPPALVAAIAELVADLVPAPLAADAQRWVASQPVRWADLGARAAVLEAPHGIAVHAAIWQYVAPHGMARLAAALGEAIAPLVIRSS